MKHRNPGGPAPEPIKVADVLRWPTAEADQRRATAPAFGTELRTFALTASVFLAKVEENDCDIHLEVGDAGGGDRVVVEIPQGEAFVDARRAVLRRLGVETLTKTPLRPKHPPSMTFTGFAFYDGDHYAHDDPQQGHNHGSKSVGTLWELHPVWRVELV